LSFGIPTAHAVPALRGRLPRTRAGRWLAALAAPAGVAFWLGDQGVRVFGIEAPPFHWSAWVVPTVLALFVIPGEPGRSVGRNDLLVAVAVLALGVPLTMAYGRIRAPLSPPEPIVRAAAPDGSAERTIRLASLNLDRESFRRLVGRPRNLAFRARGILLVPATGVYEFRLQADDHASLAVGEEALFRESTGGRARMTLDRGPVPVELAYTQTTGGATLRLSWRTPERLAVLPLENHLSRPLQLLSAEALDAQARRVALVLLTLLAWTTASVFLLFGLAESRSALVPLAQDWWRRPREAFLVRPPFWAACAVAALLGASAVADRLPGAARRARVLYERETSRIPMAVERTEGYVPFLKTLALGCGAMAAVFVIPGTLRERAWRPSPRQARALLRVATLSALAWGGLLSQWHWEGLGRPCWDQYCLYAGHLRELLTSPGAAEWRALRDHLQGDFHANSPVGPLLTALVGLVVPDIPTAYRLVSALATLATLPLLHRLGVRHLGLDATASGAAVLLWASSSQVQRSLLFTQTDPLVMLFFTAAFERLLALRRAATASTGVVLGVVLPTAIALLTKLSALPLLGVNGLLAVTRAGPPLARRLLTGALVVLAPLLALVAFMWAAGTLPNYAIELERRATADSRPDLHLVAAVSTLLPLVLAFALDRRRIDARERPFAAAIVVYLGGLWLSGGSGWERFYLVVLPLALPLAVKRLVSAVRWRPADVAVLLAFFAFIHTARLLLGVYY
jgi:hypothetical protein